ncbi:16S rRNA (cytidine(1402)-2'-O)-methyltransferase [Elizabethkingia meningoseptica]|uniref:Ribosomal RNA small subunit methyltransferase I n=1 Tax=Elizabethkingia meningoseptica TaxID=238 RepID=A0A1V3TXC5_ELIME|nr:MULTISPECIES: 16S rRNA (cytidine(1402)-2'-O)-methyltransferase [Elizabethkingia]AQX04363.1 16S rRNA (cytidine(1402)-2'-O)-methyltransferase [Elizabethkingia meningoseptica]AQX11828.1 16S rRNA (cytidine(1402)-2'-O)-methyltransferase [Elizabethkingia meningoseptica]AQX46405.1 16S rRNA methyltransferase [Elizabethkingia meningoseptica]EJK5328715.1 16S rRNA (cytidine(1402)-2'-O)-methyltransferase [Elizabethkingia meningoseptica]EOR31643.1 methyltransferase [Elizabethkingia meningoseptica ATCC 1
MSGILYFVPTPVGNLEDMTFRAIKVLKEADYILCEDTRTSGVLLKHYEISKPLRSYHLHNEHQATEKVIEDLKNGQNIALITDAGTPGISDPGYLLAKAGRDNDIEMICLPGATAFVPALVVSGLPNHDFYFAGFLPQKKGRQTKLKQLAEEKKTIVLYESPHKINTTLEQIKEFFGEHTQVSLSREISKKFEETKRGTIDELIEFSKSKTLKGEIVLILNNSI